ncbi:hypothetical protein K1719_013660 [Acacia pycnantha]|nr:hypothetical protein K1719_013660 [Acacia pycnantha]
MPYLPTSFSPSSFSIRRLKFPGTFSSCCKLASTALAYLNSTTFSDDTQLSSGDETVSSSCDCSLDSPSVHNSFEIDTFKVVETLNCFSREPALALSFFRQVEEQGFRHNIRTYAALIRILCYWGLDRKLDSLFLELISLSKECPAFEIEDLFEELLDGFRIERNVHLLRAFDALVKTYVSVDMFDEAIDFVFTRRRGIVPHIFTCNFLLNRLVKHDKVDMAFAIYKQLKRLGLSPNDFTYTIVIKALCKSGKWKQVDDVMKEIEEAGMPACSFFFSTYIEGLCNHGSPDEGYQMLQAWRNANGLIDMFAYTAVIRGFCNKMELDEAESVILDMEKQGLVPDVFIYCELIRGYCKSGNLHKALALHVAYNVLLDALCEMGKVDDASELLKYMKHKNMVLDIKHYTTLIKGYCLQGKLNLAFNTFEEMKEKGFKPDIVTYNVLASGLSRNVHADKSTKLLDYMEKFLDYMESQGVKPNSITHKMIIEGLCSRGKGFCEANFPREAYELHLMLSSQDIVVEKDSSFKLLCKLCDEGDTDRAIRLLLSLDVESSKIMCCKVIAALCQDGNMKKAHSLFESFVQRGFTPDVKTYTLMINSCCKINCLQEAHNLFQDMKKRRIKPNVITYTVLLDGHLKSNLRKNSSRGFNSSKETEILDVSTILREMQNKEIKPDVVTYTVLIDRHLMANSLQEAIMFLVEMIDDGLEPDTVTYNALISGFCNRGDMVECVRLLDDIFSPGVAIDQQIISALKRGILKAKMFQFCK